MKVSCNKGVASHVGPESCGDDRKVVVEALTGESAGRVLSLENVILWDADAVLSCGRQQRSIRQCEDRSHPTWSKTLRTHRSISRGSREILYPTLDYQGPCREPERDTPVMHGRRKSDRLVVPAKFPNKASEADGRHGAAEEMEGRSLAKEKSGSVKQAVDSVPPTCLPLNPIAATWRGMARAVISKARARCGNSARRDPCGGRRATAIPTATANSQLG